MAFAKHGINVTRIELRDFSKTRALHLNQYNDIDIALDPFPYNGTTTTCEALWMGVPVVALVGETFISRGAGSILHHAGLGDLAVDTPEEYILCAQGLAGNLTRLETLRANLREQITASPLCDTPSYVRSIETAYRDMWHKWCTHPQSTHLFVS